MYNKSDRKYDLKLAKLSIMSNIFVYVFILPLLLKSLGERVLSGTTCHLDIDCSVSSGSWSSLGDGYPNNGCWPCGSGDGPLIDGCADISGRATCEEKGSCGRRCGCASGFYWNPYKELCLAINDGTKDCTPIDIYSTSIDPCDDQTGLSTCGPDNKCICIDEYHAKFDDSTKLCRCKENYKKGSGVQICLGLNNGNSECSSTTDCYDSTNGHCLYENCQCKDGFVWSNDDHQCLCRPGTRVVDNGCVRCESGEISDMQASQCTLCPPGKYSNDDRTECLDCPEDTYGPNPGLDKCIPCETGKFQPKEGEISCIDCFEFCSKCTQSNDNCLACIDNPGIKLEGNSCVCRTNDHYYSYIHNGNRQCAPCHPLCSSCYGPLQNECHTCSGLMKATFVGIDTCDCLPGFYYEPLTRQCEDRNILFVECVDPSNSDCETCSNSFSIEGIEDLCVYNCEQLSNYYREGNTCKSNF